MSCRLRRGGVAGGDDGADSGRQGGTNTPGASPHTAGSPAKKHDPRAGSVWHHPPQPQHQVRRQLMRDYPIDGGARQVNADVESQAAAQEEAEAETEAMAEAEARQLRTAAAIAGARCALAPEVDAPAVDYESIRGLLRASAADPFVMPGSMPVLDAVLELLLSFREACISCACISVF